MNVEQLQSHLVAARALLDEGDLPAAAQQAELAVDEFWKLGDDRIAEALPLLSLLRYASEGNRADGDLFESLDDLPKSLSFSLLEEAAKLHDDCSNDASAKMLSDVRSFLSRWIGESAFENEVENEVETEPSLAEESIAEPVVSFESLDEPSTEIEPVPDVEPVAEVEPVPEVDPVPEVEPVHAIEPSPAIQPDEPEPETVEPTNPVDEKIHDLRAQIKQFYAEGERELAVETSLELANEYAIRGKKQRASDLFVQVLKKSKLKQRTKLRLAGLLDFGRFLLRIRKPNEAQRILRIAAGVAKKAGDEEKFSLAIAWLGIALMHDGQRDAAKRFLGKAATQLSPWDVEADLVKQHLEALDEGSDCACPEATIEMSLSGADWD
ncbi:hypothetical protein [Mariniblastus fucicola]|uniref:Tetratricopeptide repeat protein n=1 Tax=Mariniblastus fucicola TaxID=980251 RepID=A0A5B9PLG7_9BACT|nr:hypothetical protein [Mariniblastus fucicola]QEG23183.1 hypothetical protein MFFC18_30790 [Mariniblastus fucicola]